MQLLRLKSAFEDCDVAYATVLPSYEQDVPGSRFYAIPDATRWNRAKLVLLGLTMMWVFLRERPNIVVTTGAAPGYLAMIMGRLCRARTIWIDSIANVDQMSMSGEKAKPHADLWLTQWPHLAKPAGPRFAGAVL